jgi:nucleoid-associated protein
MITVHYAVIHELIKTAGTMTAEANPAKKLLPVSSDVVIKLISELDKLYGTKENNAIYGTFSRGDSTNQFPNYTELFIEDNTESNFFAFSIRGLEEITREAGGRQSSTGGYMVFSYYSNVKMQAFLLIVMIKNKNALKINQDLELEDVIQIDLSKIHQAARINLDKFQKSKETWDDSINAEDGTSNYLSFVSPRSNKDASGYFIQGLDCKDGVRPTVATDNAFICVKTYCNDKKELKSFRNQVNDSLVEYFEKCLKTEKLATLAGIEHSIRQAIPAEHHASLEDFIEHANNEKWQIPAEFNVSKDKLKKYTRIRSKTDSWELNFRRTALGITTNSDLYFNEETGKLTISCSEDLKKQITEELNDRNAN